MKAKTRNIHYNDCVCFLLMEYECVKSVRKLLKHPIYITICIIPFSEQFIGVIRCNHLTDENRVDLQMFMANYYIVSWKTGMTKFFYLQKLIQNP